ncbi:uncharacterized protein H6S33_007941 [Morchella sextelata]|uniref:uncharacterized protein n=1 Tax=Morchella sextelata TaxID=1174677 RepID=UPI001D04F9B3|nr:uncharacterized protein H6S33_007941 [Morchella sextelata]KAH0602937.1 hypothetical protein H6S33_007941 [Morchella sextelata]
MTTSINPSVMAASTRDIRKAEVAAYASRIAVSITETAAVINSSTFHVKCVNVTLAALGYDIILHAPRPGVNMTAEMRDLVFEETQISLYKDYKMKEIQLYHELRCEILKEEMEQVEREKAQDEAAGIVEEEIEFDG